ncbi:MAG TPA: hypothetical protein PLZ79_07165 [Burkholderiales bacterium]|nr:hypothetical protein [Burkholderiales bacterium]
MSSLGKPWSCVHVSFDLPFLLNLKDSLRDCELEEWAEAYRSGKVDLPFSPYAPRFPTSGRMVVHLPQRDLAEPYEVTLSDIRVQLRTIRRGNPSRPYDQLGESQGDRLGRFSFSTADVAICSCDLGDDPFSNGNPSPLDVFVEIAVRAVNHFIEHYRVLADRAHIGPVTEVTIQSFRIAVEFDDGNQWMTGIGHAPGGGFELNELSHDVDRRLRERVGRSDAPPIELTLEANIQDYMALRDYRRAIIEAAILFEAWITGYLRGRFAMQGLDSAAIDEKFSDDRGYPRSATWIAQNLVKDATGFDFKSAAECADWKVNVVNKRNDLMHGKSFSASWREAYAAVCAVQNARKLLGGK